MELIRCTVGEMLAHTAARYPQSCAIEYMGKQYSYLWLDGETDRLACGLLALGVQKGDHIGIWANDRPQTLLCYYAMEKIGAVPVMLGTSLHPREVAQLLAEADVQYLFFDEGFKGTSFVDACRGEAFAGLRRLVYIGPGSAFHFCTLGTLLAEGEHIAQPALAAAKAAVSPDDIDVILFTSGTTGSPKGVLTTHYSRVNNARAHAVAMEMGPEDKICVAIPMFHCFCLSSNLLAALSVGACVCYPPNRRTETLLRTIEKSGCTVFSTVPTLFSALIARNDLDSFNLSSLRVGIIGGALYEASFYQSVCDALRYDLRPSLGQTEATAGFTIGNSFDPLSVKARTVGHFMEHIEHCIKDITTGEPLPPGEAGDICIRGYSVMQGYYKQPELTKQIIDAEGWLHTGDVGYLDERGNLRLTGRVKELIIRAGENIAPAEIERILEQDPRIARAKAVGVPDKHYGEEICACIVPADDTTLTADEVRLLVSERLAAFKVPRYVVFLKEFPLSGSNKVMLHKLKDMAVKALRESNWQ